MNIKLGFIGCGNMARAIINGILEKKLIAAGDIYASDISESASEYCKTKAINFSYSNDDICAACDIIVLAVKPQFLKQALHGASKSLEDKAVLSIAASWTYEMLKEQLPKSRILRTIPNTQLQIGEGFTAFSMPTDFSTAELEAAETIFSAMGTVRHISDRYMDAVTAIGSAGGVYAFMLVEAMADGGVKAGLSRDEALQISAQAILGGAKLILQTGAHPGELKDRMCSPGGVTIESVYALEKNSFKGAVMEAVNAAVARGKSISAENK